MVRIWNVSAENGRPREILVAGKMLKPGDSVSVTEQTWFRLQCIEDLRATPPKGVR